MHILRKSAGLRRRRGSTMIEFALLLPMLMFMLLFTIDMGHYILVSNSMKDATYAAAMTGAQAGGAGMSSTGSKVCSDGGTCKGSVAYRVLQEYADVIPAKGTLDSMVVKSGAQCKGSGDDLHVVLTTQYSVKWLTPGMATVLRLIDASNTPTAGSQGTLSDVDGWPITSTAVVRCQVLR